MRQRYFKTIAQYLKHHSPGQHALGETLVNVVDLGFALGEEEVRTVAAYFNRPIAFVQQLITSALFLKQQKVARHEVRVCVALPCAMREGTALIDTIEQLLGIEVGDVTGDGQFRLSATGCLGLCDDAPALTVDGKRFGNMTPDKARRILIEIMELDDKHGH